MITLVAIIKNEAPYLLEWIAYHRLIGVAHFIILDNDSTDGGPILLDPLARAGVLEWHPWPARAQFRGFEGKRTGPQVPAYAYALDLARRAGRQGWLGFIDIDEFVVTPAGAPLEPFLEAMGDVSAVGINWRVFGSAGLLEKPKGLTIEHFLRRAPDDFGPNRHVKSFVRIERLGRPGIHVPQVLEGPMVDQGGEPIDPRKGGVHARAVHAPLCIHHYFTRSRAEWELKRRRGRAGMPLSAAERIRADTTFTGHDRNEVADETLLPLVPAVKEQMRKLTQLTRRTAAAALPPGMAGEGAR